MNLIYFSDKLINRYTKPKQEIINLYLNNPTQRDWISRMDYYPWFEVESISVWYGSFVYDASFEFEQ